MKTRIAGFAQHRNELSKGNLHNWLKCMDVCDVIYVYDQASDDGSLEVLRENPKVRLIESNENLFSKELIAKQQLLEKLTSENLDIDWILWIDCDTVLENALYENSGKKLFEVLVSLPEDVDAVSLGHYNLWRSDFYYRTDNLYNWLHENGVVALWRNNGKLAFPLNAGLHHKMYPNGIEKIHRCDYSLIHKGFSTDSQIIERYKLYKSFGQSGHNLSRLIDEKTLTVSLIDKNKIPLFMKDLDKSNPTTKPKIKDLYKDIL